MRAIDFAICVIYHTVLIKVSTLADDGYYDEFLEPLKNMEKKGKSNPQDELEVKAGNVADYFGVNKHTFVPPEYKDFGRRFILQYPYNDSQGKPGEIQNDNAAEANLDRAIEQLKKKSESEEERLIPRQAPSEIVLEVAKQSAKMQAMKPVNRANEFMEKEYLRTGKFWNDVWVEEIDKPTSILRSHNKKLRADINVKKIRPKLDVVRVRVMPGSKLHDLVSQAKKISPRLLYIMNKRNNK